MISFGIVGSGYRAEYFGRIARTYPDIFRAIYLCRSAECLKKARKSRRLERALSCEIPDEVYDRLEADLCE